MFVHLASGPKRRSAYGHRRFITAVRLGIVAVLVLSVPAYAVPVNPRFAITLSPLGNEAIVNWEPASSTNGTVTYHVYRAMSGAGTFSWIGSSVGLNNCSYIDTGTVNVAGDVTTTDTYVRGTGKLLFDGKQLPFITFSALLTSDRSDVTLYSLRLKLAINFIGCFFGSEHR